MISAFSAIFRSLAEKRGRPKAIAAAMVDPDVELREVTVGGRKEIVPGEVAEELAKTGAQLGAWVTRRGKLLTLTGKEAAELRMANGVCNSLEDVLKRLGLNDESARSIVEKEYGWRLQEIKKWLDIQISASKGMMDPGAFDAKEIRRGNTSGVGFLARSRVNCLDDCLELYDKVLAIAGACPTLKVDEEAVRRKMAVLREWRANPYRKAPSGL
jgi:hypothetical protein